MDREPRLLIWNYTVDEKRKVDELLQEIGAPSAVTIAKTRGHLTLKEIIHTDARSEQELTSHEKVILFYNIPQKGISFLIHTFKQADLPSPIYAVVTEHSIEWPLSELIEHLVEERDKMEKLSAANRGE